MKDELTALIEYVQPEGRVCPMPTFWNHMWNMLPDRRQKANGGWEPSLPLILAAWWDTTAEQKRDRLKLHIEYAANKGMLDKIDKFLRELKPNQWVYGNGTTQWEEWKAKKA
jgi:hypothetical protein